MIHMYNQPWAGSWEMTLFSVLVFAVTGVILWKEFGPSLMAHTSRRLWTAVAAIVAAWAVYAPWDACAAADTWWEYIAYACYLAT